MTNTADPIFSIEKILRENSYPGRGIIAGLTPDGRKAVSVYFIMGRSAHSRNRVFAEKNGEITIYPFDKSKVKDPSLIIYAPVKKVEDSLIVTNGDQTDTVYEYLKNGKPFESALETRTFEPDAPNFTPRISALLDMKDGFFYKMNILKSADEKGLLCHRHTFSYAPLRGLGHFLHTYARDGHPLPSFAGEPRRVEIWREIGAYAAAIWNALNEENKISLFVRYDDLQNKTYETRLFNKLTPPGTDH